MNRAGAVRHSVISTYQAALLAGQPDAVARMVGPEHDPQSSPGSVETHIRELLRPFRQVTRAEAAMLDFQDDGDLIQVDFRVRLDGEGELGQRLTVRARSPLELARINGTEGDPISGDWVIVGHGPFETELESKDQAAFLDATVALGAKIGQVHPEYGQTNKLMSNL